MAYCPVCGVEYQEGIEQCVDCHVALQPGPPPPPPPKEVTPEARLVRIRVFRGPQAVMQGDLARNILETEGIPCVLPGQFTGEMLPGIDALQLFVRESDAERAREVLQSYFDTPHEI
jgi:Putative prokaryotic signal transducing protein